MSSTKLSEEKMVYALGSYELIVGYLLARDQHSSNAIINWHNYNA